MGVQKPARISGEDESSAMEEAIAGEPAATPARTAEIEDISLISEASPRKARTYEDSESARKSVVCTMMVLVACAMFVSINHMAGSPGSVLGLQIVRAGRLCSYAERNACPADEFVVNPEVHEVATATLVEVASAVSVNLDWTLVKPIVVESFRNIRAGLKRGAPDLSATLASVPITGMQKEAILELMRLIRNPRVQSIGFEIAEVIRASEGTGRYEVRNRIQQKLYKRREEILALRHELISEPLLSFWGVGDEWRMTLDPENINIMESVSGDWMGLINENTMPHIGEALARTDLMAQSDGVRGGILEEGRVLLDMIEFLAHSLGKDLTMPHLAVSFNKRFGAGRFVARQFRCDLDSPELSLWFLRSTLCLLKFGTQGVDALRAAPELMQVIPELDTNSTEFMFFLPEVASVAPATHTGADAATFG